ncbi:MAG: KamA family radical SAM protein [Planctomycetes bacterium]|nr:KamA family radical SAM protein [Planctomycetota bacterium]
MVDRIPEGVRERLTEVQQRYAFRVSDYYLSLIDWDDPADPLRRIVMPDEGELADWGSLDASNEAAHYVAPAVQHKYEQTVLLLVNEVCGAYCRYCFRKRLFMEGNDETSLDIGPGLAYIREHPEVTNVLFTGGDPLILGTARIAEILAELRSIPHVSIIRFGSKMPAFNPFRILDDDRLVEVLSRHSLPDKRIYLMAHFDHPREFTPEAVAAMDRVIRAGVICVNQCPVIGGVNDDPATLKALFRKGSHTGVPQYYLFQGRPTAGNLPYAVPIVRGFLAFDEARRGLSGLAKRTRFVMSHESGKIEIVAVDESRIYLRYHRARDPADRGRFMVCRRDDNAGWLDDLEPGGERGAGGFDDRALGPE